jgi:hypothetical protein
VSDRGALRLLCVFPNVARRRGLYSATPRLSNMGRNLLLDCCPCFSGYHACFLESPVVAAFDAASSIFMPFRSVSGVTAFL